VVRGLSPNGNFDWTDTNVDAPQLDWLAQALVEGAGPWNSAYAIVDVMPDLELRVLGYRRAEARSFRAGAARALRPTSRPGG